MRLFAILMIVMIAGCKSSGPINTNEFNATTPWWVSVTNDNMKATSTVKEVQHGPAHKTVEP